MALNVSLQLYRGTLAALSTLPTTGNAGVAAWTTDSNELYVDTGTGLPGIGTGKAWQKVAADNAVFEAANPAALLALDAKIGDFALSASDGSTYMLTTYPPTAAANWKVIATTTPAAPAGFTDVEFLASATAHEFVTYISSDGVQHLAQPSFSDLSGALSQTQLPTSIGAGASLTSIDLGTF